MHKIENISLLVLLEVSVESPKLMQCNEGRQSSEMCPQSHFHQPLGDPKMLKLQSLLMLTSASKPPLS